MSIEHRKAKEKEELKALILKGAMKLFLEKGIEQTTIRSIATAINYSVGTIYVYYRDKDAILYDLHQQGFQQLGGKMRVLFNVANPMERLKAIGKTYLQFALENPDMYDLMFNLKAPMESLKAAHAEEWNEGKATFAVLTTTVSQCMEAGFFKGQQLEPLSFAIWGSVHGMCSLYIRGRTQGVKFQNPDTILEEGFAALTRMMEAQ